MKGQVAENKIQDRIQTSLLSVKRVLPPHTEKLVLLPLLYLLHKVWSPFPMFEFLITVNNASEMGNAFSSPKVRSLAKVAPYVAIAYSFYIANRGLLVSGDGESNNSQVKPNPNQDDAPFHKDKIYTIVGKVSPVVVHISLHKEFGSNSEENIASGIIFDRDGFILTCTHGVANSLYKKVYVSLLDQQTFEGTVIIVRKKYGIAIVKINPYFPLPTTKFGSSCKLCPEDHVVAVGSPKPFENNFIHCKVSKDADLIDGMNYLQMDGLNSMANSGGPIVDMNGKIVGINILKVFDNNRLSFVLPIDRVSNSIRWLTYLWKAQQHWFGFKMANLGEVFDIIQIKNRYLKFPDVKEGVVIAEVKEGSPAHNAGFEPGDVVLQFGGQAITSAREIINMMKSRKTIPVDVIVKRGMDALIHLTLTPPEEKD